MKAKLVSESLNNNIINIPNRIENIMRRTSYSNNREFWNLVPKYMKQPNTEKTNTQILQNFIDNNIQYKEYIEKYWRDVYKDQQRKRNLYK